MAQLTDQEKTILLAKQGFDHGWEAALDEAIAIVDAAVFNGEDAAQALETLREFRNANK